MILGRSLPDFFFCLTSLSSSFFSSRELGGAFSPAVVFPSQRLSESQDLEAAFKDMQSPGVSPRYQRVLRASLSMSQSGLNFRQLHTMQEEESVLSDSAEADDVDDDDEIDLMYDPCLNCFFDPRTNKYYELAQ